MYYIRFRSIKETAPETESVLDEHHQTVVSSAEYSHNNGTKYTVITENKKGREEFADFYTNKSSSARSSNTQLSAQADSITAPSADKDNINSVNTLNILPRYHPNIRFRAIKDTAPETVSVHDEHHQTVVSSADGAKILKDIDDAIKQYANDSITKEKTFIGNLGGIWIRTKKEFAKFASAVATK